MAGKVLNNKELEEVLLSELDISKGKKAEVIVYNDDVNTFDWVIQCFVEVCIRQFTRIEAYKRRAYGARSFCGN